MIRRAVVVLCVIAATLSLFVRVAPAQAPDAQGWWWVGGTPLGLAPPYVPADGLYVASNPSGPEAVSALRFRLAGAGGAGTLTLEVAGDVRGTPVVGLCALATPWEPTQGGPLSAAPACDPNGPTAPGTVAGDGKTVTFPVGALVRDGTLDVGVIPGAAEGGGNPTFQLALAKPGDGALAPAASADGGSGSGGAFEEPASFDAGTSPSPVDSGSFTPAPAFDTGSVTPFEPLPADAPLAVGIPPSATPGSTSGGGLATTPVAGGTGRSGGSEPVDEGPWRIVGFVVLAGTALVYHRLSTTMDRPPRSLVAFGHAMEEPA